MARYVSSYPWPLNFDALQQAARLFIGTHDFLSFAATDPDDASRAGQTPVAGPEMDDNEPGRAGSVRTIFGSDWERRPIEDGTILFVYRVRGSGFLHHMVRNL